MFASSERFDVVGDCCAHLYHLWAFFVAETVVKEFKRYEEGGKTHEAQIVEQSWGATLVDTMTVKLGDPCYNVQDGCPVKQRIILAS